MENAYFVPLQSRDFAQKVTQIINTKEAGVILFPPNTAKSNRLGNFFIENYKSRLNDFKIVKYDFTFYETEDILDFRKIFQRELIIARKKKIGILLANVQTLIFDKNYNLLNGMIDLQEEYPNLSMVFLFNVDVTHPEISKNIRTSLFSYIAYYPFYGRTDTIGFIDHLVKKWNISFDAGQREAIADLCGGYFWLVKQAVIFSKDNPKLPPENFFRYEGVKIALEQLYASLLQSERDVLHNIVLGHKTEDILQKHSYNHLEKIGLINKGGITIQLLESYIREFLPKMKVELIEDRIFINLVNVDNQFSKKEKKVFKVLIKNTNRVVTRDELAKAIWPINTEDYYSDWAVDRLVARLRSKIADLGMTREAVKTVRNQGYTLTN